MIFLLLYIASFLITFIGCIAYGKANKEMITIGMAMEFFSVALIPVLNLILFFIKFSEYHKLSIDAFLNKELF